MLTIRAAVLEGPRDDEVLGRLVASGICRTDIDLSDDWEEEDGPVVPGHEGAGGGGGGRQGGQGRQTWRPRGPLLSALRPLPGIAGRDAPHE